MGKGKVGVENASIGQPYFLSVTSSIVYNCRACSFPAVEAAYNNLSLVALAPSLTPPSFIAFQEYLPADFVCALENVWVVASGASALVI